MGAGGGYLGCRRRCGSPGQEVVWGSYEVVSVHIRPKRRIPGGNCEDSSGNWWWENWAVKEQPLQKWEQVVKTWTRCGEGAVCGLTHTKSHTWWEFSCHPTFLIHVEPKWHKELVVKGFQGCKAPKAELCIRVASIHMWLSSS